MKDRSQQNGSCLCGKVKIEALLHHQKCRRLPLQNVSKMGFGLQRSS